MAQLANFIAVVAVATLFWLWVPLGRLYSAMPQIVTALSIVSAALFVRLNRGMPTIDWKSIAPTMRKDLTRQIQSITGEYVVILGISGSLTVILIGLQIVSFDVIKVIWPQNWQRDITALVGGMVMLSVARMVYVVWRDYDIVRTQRKVLDLAADADQISREEKAATEKISAIKEAGLRILPRGEPKNWED